MADTATPSWPRRLRHTPMRDLLRGRLTGRLDWRQALAAARLPAAIEARVAEIVRRTWLWHVEKVDVARDLTAHFADGLAAGVSADDLLRDFGDARAAARLIRRAKHRDRPLVWHLMKWWLIAFTTMMIVYLGLVARFYLARPSPSVDYLALINAPILAVPMEDRAWPLYRKTIVNLSSMKPNGDDLPWQQYAPRWDDYRAWIEAHPGEFDLIRAAAAKPALGFVLGRDGSAYDEGMLTRQPSDPANRNTNAGGAGELLIGVLLPHLNAQYAMANVLAADAHFARLDKDAARLRRDIDALLGMYRQFLAESDGLMVSELVATGVQSVALREIERTLRLTPELLTDADLVAMSHRLAGPRTAADLLTLTGERAFLYDMVQRTYTDDGHGDGRLTARGLKFANLFTTLLANGPRSEKSEAVRALADAAALPAVTAFSGSRRDATAAIDRMLARAAANFARPLRDLATEPPAPIAAASPANPLAGQLNQMAASYADAQLHVERMLAQRDGIQMGLALELYRRRHSGVWPASLGELVPRLLPTIPVDPITGGPLHYRIENGRPLVYSVGGDRDDDHGRPPANKDGKPAGHLAAAWSSTNVADGDWPIFPTIPDAELETP